MNANDIVAVLSLTMPASMVQVFPQVAMSTRDLLNYSGSIDEINLAQAAIVIKTRQLHSIDEIQKGQPMPASFQTAINRI